MLLAAYSLQHKEGRRVRITSCEEPLISGSSNHVRAHTHQPDVLDVFRQHELVMQVQFDYTVILQLC